jgi:hypothetical protein
MTRISAGTARIHNHPHTLPSKRSKRSKRSKKPPIPWTALDRLDRLNWGVGGGNVSKQPAEFLRREHLAPAEIMIATRADLIHTAQCAVKHLSRGACV